MTSLAYPFVVKPGEGVDAPLARLGTVHKVPAFATEGLSPLLQEAGEPDFAAIQSLAASG